MPMQLIESHLFIKFNPSRCSVTNEILHRSVFQAMTYHFNLRFYITSMNKALLLLSFILMSQYAIGQSDIGIGQWKSYLPHNAAKYVTQSDEKIIYATDLSIFTIDKEDESIEYISKVEGLSETGISAIEYDNFNDQLIIVYDNSVIDIVKDDEIIGIFDISDNNNFVDRKITDVFIQNENWAYFSTGFGVVQYNLKDLEFGFTLDANRRMNSISGNEDYLVMESEDISFILDYKNERFPNAFSSWKPLSQGLPNGYNTEALTLIGDRIYLAEKDSVYVAEIGQDFVPTYNIPEDNTVEIIEETLDGWFIGLRDSGFSSSLLFFDDQDGLIDEINSCVARLRDAIVTEDGSIYFADDFDNVRFIKDGQCFLEQYKGPFGAEASDIEIEDDIVYVASGGVSENFANLNGRKGIYILTDGIWNNINQDNNPFYKEPIENESIELLQHYQIEKHPRKPLLYIGTFWAGLIEMNLETGEQVLYNTLNSDDALGPPLGDNPLGVKISGLTFDRNNNLWISVFGAERPIAVLTDEGTWHSFSVSSDRKTSDIIVDDSGNVWCVIGGNTGGVMVLNPGNSIADPSDDLPSRFINLNNSEIQSNLVNAVAEDLDGSVWVGTGEGVVVFDCGLSATESSCEGNRPKVLEGVELGRLLETEDVQAIAVDGANRKWFGTRNGIFVQSPNGEDQVARYNEENSPLFDNNIKAMTYNGNTGEMVISTNKGLQSLKTETTGATNKHASQVYAYPNPVRPGYQGPIAIKGLARDAEVRITDIDGQLVYKTVALGGQAIWDGNDLNGQIAAGGVYLVFSSSTDTFRDIDAFVTKILIVR